MTDLKSLSTFFPFYKLFHLDRNERNEGQGRAERKLAGREGLRVEYGVEEGHVDHGELQHTPAAMAPSMALLVKSPSLNRDSFSERTARAVVS